MASILLWGSKEVGHTGADNVGIYICLSLQLLVSIPQGNPYVHPMLVEKVAYATLSLRLYVLWYIQVQFICNTGSCTSTQGYPPPVVVIFTHLCLHLLWFLWFSSVLPLTPPPFQLPQLTSVFLSISYHLHLSPSCVIVIYTSLPYNYYHLHPSSPMTVICIRPPFRYHYWHLSPL